MAADAHCSFIGSGKCCRSGRSCLDPDPSVGIGIRIPLLFEKENVCRQHGIGIEFFHDQRWIRKYRPCLHFAIGVEIFRCDRIIPRAEFGIGVCGISPFGDGISREFIESESGGVLSEKIEIGFRRGWSCLWRCGRRIFLCAPWKQDDREQQDGWYSHTVSFQWWNEEWLTTPY